MWYASGCDVWSEVLLLFFLSCFICMGRDMRTFASSLMFDRQQPKQPLDQQADTREAEAADYAYIKSDQRRRVKKYWQVLRTLQSDPF